MLYNANIQILADIVPFVARTFLRIGLRLICFVYLCDHKYSNMGNNSNTTQPTTLVSFIPLVVLVIFLALSIKLFGGDAQHTARLRDGGFASQRFQRIYQIKAYLIVVFLVGIVLK